VVEHRPMLSSYPPDNITTLLLQAQRNSYN